MAGLSDAAETALLELIFKNTNYALIGDATGLRGSSTAGVFYLTLHTADPGDAGTALTSEIAYTSYARVSVARSGAGFVVTGNSVSPAATVSFPTGTGGSGTATHWGITTTASGAVALLLSGPITPNIVCGNGITPQLTTATAVTAD